MDRYITPTMQHHSVIMDLEIIVPTDARIDPQALVFRLIGGLQGVQVLHDLTNQVVHPAGAADIRRPGVQAALQGLIHLRVVQVLHQEDRVHPAGINFLWRIKGEIRFDDSSTALTILHEFLSKYRGRYLRLKV